MFPNWGETSAQLLDKLVITDSEVNLNEMYVLKSRVVIGWYSEFFVCVIMNLTNRHLFLIMKCTSAEHDWNIGN